MVPARLRIIRYMRSKPSFENYIRSSEESGEIRLEITWILPILKSLVHTRSPLG